MNTLRDWFHWWLLRDSNSACLVLIDLAETMNDRDLVNMRDYLDSLKQLRDASH